MDTFFDGVTSLIVLALGASIGSFLNVVVYRLPAGLSILWPPSRCPHCLHQLGKQENVPILGWLWLKGRCRHCRSRISARYPLVEAATGILYLLVFWIFGLSGETLAYWVFVSWLMALSLIDLDTMTLPNVLTQSGLVLGLLFQAIAGFLPNSSGIELITHLMSGLIGMVVGIWLFDMITWLGSAVFGQSVMGGGDAKLAAMMGAWLGWQYLLLAGFIACAIGAFGGVTVIALGRMSRRQQIPFGPFLALGAGIALFWGQPILSAYLKLFFPLNS